MKTILLVFVHGFKGGLDTFGRFPQDLQESLSTASTLCDLEYRSIIYPPYETKGDFQLAVSKLRDWLQETVIDIESGRGTASATINGSVKIVLLAHSMGGLVSADVILAMHQDYAPADSFPHVIGLVALDSPMLGLAPSLWLNGAGDLFQRGKSLYDSAAGLTAIGSGLFASKVIQGQEQKTIEESKREEEEEQKKKKKGGYLGWRGLTALSAVGALAAGGALYAQKETLSRGYSWVSDHLEFIGALRKSQELSDRTIRLNSLDSVRFSCYYTLLTNKSSIIDGADRTFVLLPKGDLLKSRFHAQENVQASDEVAAHTGMFLREKNSGYDSMLREIAGEIRTWAEQVTAKARMPIQDVEMINNHLSERCGGA